MHSTENPTNSQVASDGHLSHRVVDCALAMAAKGFRVFPIQENGKLPLLGISWKKLATSDPARIKKLWGDKNYNFGIDLRQIRRRKDTSHRSTMT